VDINNLFLHTIRDLEQRSTASDEYEVLMAAVLLRKLLLDSKPLMDQVNRRFKLKLRFRISSESPLERQIYATSPTFWAIEDALNPESPLAYEPYDATRDQFLARPIMCFDGHRVTVRDVILQVANIEGAVHRSDAKTGREEALRAAAEFYSRDHLSGVVSQVRLIGRITVRSLSPLRDVVIRSSPTLATTERDAIRTELRLRDRQHADTDE
jgi:hypothetical protein